MSPEMLRKNYDEKCDIWAVAVIIFFMITQKYPCIGRSGEEIKKNVLKFNFE